MSGRTCRRTDRRLCFAREAELSDRWGGSSRPERRDLLSVPRPLPRCTTSEHELYRRDVIGFALNGGAIGSAHC
jgi:hypothetical protein